MLFILQFLRKREWSPYGVDGVLLYNLNDRKILFFLSVPYRVGEQKNKIAVAVTKPEDHGKGYILHFILNISNHITLVYIQRKKRQAIENKINEVARIQYKSVFC